MECALSYSYCTSHGQLSFSMKKKIDHDVELKIQSILQHECCTRAIAVQHKQHLGHTSATGVRHN